MSEPYAYFYTSGQGYVLQPLGTTVDGAIVFTDLNDVPSSYSGQSLKRVRVNAGATALEFFVPALIGNSDFPANYTSAAGKYLLVNSAGTAVEFNYPTGVINGGDAAVGKVGEFLTATASTVSLVSATAKTAVSISLTAGDWDVGGLVTYTPAGSTSVTLITSGISITNNGFNAVPSYSHLKFAAFVPGNPFAGQVTPTVRMSLSSITTIYLVARATFTVSTMTVDGDIWARRMR